MKSISTSIHGVHISPSSTRVPAVSWRPSTTDLRRSLPDFGLSSSHRSFTPTHWLAHMVSIQHRVSVTHVQQWPTTTMMMIYRARAHDTLLFIQSRTWQTSCVPSRDLWIVFFIRIESRIESAIRFVFESNLRIESAVYHASRNTAWWSTACYTYSEYLIHRYFVFVTNESDVRTTELRTEYLFISIQS